MGRMGQDELAAVTALVDTGAAHSVMLESLMKRLGLFPLKYRPDSIADGSQVEYGYGATQFALDGRGFRAP